MQSGNQALLGQIFDLELVPEIIEHAPIHSFSPGDFVAKQGQYLSHVPVVLTGLVKVSSVYYDREYLLYYLSPGDFCIMGFSSGLNHQPCSVFALAEEESSVLMIPIEKLREWEYQFPKLRKKIQQAHLVRYESLLEHLHLILFEKIDRRLWEYLIKKASIQQQPVLQMTHKEIAYDIGTAREVVSRQLKVFERQGKLTLEGGKIQLTQPIEQ
ncbi:Crp/Fnr family transcriptional regulator [Pontibacter sp. G13]|uniref:Crp/Fnr family transcriptional regulator n=1 Tax=Pontibacter sp. G13 TaxID=3074898 RepID=UPI0028897E85|nr:Crp/Fnr family transcriptional regulator [Pontibacter sp. G13]WNJ16733.1 Crp/Fnr family transcriptional regulator [Pontibacter sp. G13]